MKYEYFKAGEAVFKFGEHGDKFFVMLKGEVCVKIPDPKYKKPVSKPGKTMQHKHSMLSD